MDTSYDPKKVNVNVDGSVIVGFSSDGIISVSKNEDTVTPNVGCQGDVVYEENANGSGTISLTLQGISPSLPKLRSLSSNRRKFSVTISVAKTKSVTINGVEFTLQSVSPTWYLNHNDETGMTSAKPKTARYMDGLFRNVVVSPKEVQNEGMGYFDAAEDLSTAEGEKFSPVFTSLTILLNQQGDQEQQPFLIIL